jgi:hypothetical protein
MSSDSAGGQGQPRGDVDAVAQAFYTRELSLPEIARSRAQAGFTISTVIAGGLIAAGLLSQLSLQSPWLLSVGALTVLLWLGTSVLFLWAIAVPVKLNREEGFKGEADFVQVVLSSSKKNHGEIVRRSRLAVYCAVAALLATFATVVLIPLAPRLDSRTAAADVVLNEWGLRLVSGTCPHAVISMKPPTVIAYVDPKALTADPISLRLGAGQCGGVSDESIDLPQQDIQAIVVHSECHLPGSASIPYTSNQLPVLYRPEITGSSATLSTDIGQPSDFSVVSFQTSTTPTPTPSPVPSPIPTEKIYFIPGCSRG